MTTMTTWTPLTLPSAAQHSSVQPHTPQTESPSDFEKAASALGNQTTNTPVQTTTAQCSPVQPNIAQYIQEQPSTAKQSALQLSTAQYIPVQPTRAQHSTVRPSTFHYSLLTSSHLLPYLPFQKPHSLLCLAFLTLQVVPGYAYVMTCAFLL